MKTGDKIYSIENIINDGVIIHNFNNPYFINTYTYYTIYEITSNFDYLTYFSDKEIHKYFISEKKLRKLKLQKINESR